jgi:hypothetical protein
MMEVIVIESDPIVTHYYLPRVDDSRAVLFVGGEHNDIKEESPAYLEFFFPRRKRDSRISGNCRHSCSYSIIKP